MNGSPDAPSGVVENVQRLAAAWVPTQRWFSGKGRDARIAVERLTELAPTPQVTLWLARVDYGNGEVETYLLPLVARAEPVGTLEHVLLGSVGTEAGTRWVYDALHDKDATPVWLAGIRAAITDPASEPATDADADADTDTDTDTDTKAGSGPVRFTAFVDSPDDIPVSAPSLVLSGEQSNTSMVFGDVAIMKVFRRLQPGLNPDIEVQGGLSKLGAKHIARMLGAVEADIDGAVTSIAMLQEFLTSATDGWVLATASVRDLMAEGDIHAAEAGGDFAGEAERLGAAVADVHTGLVTAFGTREASADDLRARAQSMQERLDRARSIVPQLSDVAETLSAIYAAVAGLDDAVTVQRIHGDLHLGQALRTLYRWVLIDFEGEPMADIDSRRDFDSPLRDVAGMLRSFDYAGYHQVTDFGNDAQRTYRAAEWATRNRDAFCAGYASVAGADPRAHRVLLRAFEADKAVYEAVYEARNRPAWLAIPLASLHRLADSSADPKD